MNTKNTRDAILICLVMSSSCLANESDGTLDLDENGAFENETPKPRYRDPAWDEITPNKRAQRLADRASDATIEKWCAANGGELSTENLAAAWAEAAAWIEGGWQKPGDENAFVMPKPKKAKHVGDRLSSSGSTEVEEAIASDAAVADAEEQIAIPRVTTDELPAAEPSDEELAELEEDPIGYDSIPAGGMGEPVS